MITAGTIIQNKYEILKLVGKGGMSKVYLAMDQNLNKQWAVKEIEKHPEDKNNTIIIQSALAEANMIKRLDHPLLPRIVDIIDKPEAIYIVMDYIEGEALSKVLDRQGAQPQNEVIGWAIDLCKVLDYLHTQNPPIIYRDMKPANIMLLPNGSVKLIDFGIAREYKNENMADTVSLGTRGYAAPEQFGGKGQTDVRTDIYSLGVTLYHLLTGHNPSEPPYEVYPIRHWNPRLSSGLESIILKCTQANPQDRYQSCVELLYALEHYGEMDESYRSAQRQKLNKFIASAAAAAFCLVIGSSCFALHNYMNKNDYDSNIRRAEMSSTSKERIEYYTKAMDIKPANTKAYFGIIEAFKDDAVFDEEEEALLKKRLNSNLEALQANSDFGELSYEVGKLYWYYYDYGQSEVSDNQITRMKSAVQWFDAACTYSGEEKDYYTTARVYRDIGQFNRDITLSVQEASDKGMYLPYWENIKQLVSIISDSDEQREIVSLEAYKLAVNAMDTYPRKFKGEGVTHEDMASLLEQVRTGIEQTDTTTDKTDEMKADIIAWADKADEAIELAYAQTQEAKR